MIRRRPAVLANEIRMKRSQHLGAFIIVEGKDDRLFSERFFLKETCKIIVADGKGNVCDVVRILDDDGFRGHLGVVDSDFDRIEGRPPLSSNLVSHDLHDLECMLLQSNALELLLGEFGSREKLEGFGHNVRCALLTAAYPIGCLRLHSERTELRLNFQELTYTNCIDSDTLQINRGSLIREVKNRSQRPDIDEGALNEAIKTIEAEELDPWAICAGPDLMGILSLGLRRALGSNKAATIQEEHLQRCLRLAYSNDEFAVSVLRSRLCDWESRNLPYRILQ
jgi:hypothetical protein